MHRQERRRLQREEQKKQSKLRNKKQPSAPKEAKVEKKETSFIITSDDLARMLVKNNYLGQFEAFLDDGTLINDLHCMDPTTGENLLHISTRKNFADISRILIKHNVSVTKRSHLNGLTCLHHAASHNNIDLVKELLDAGADPLIEDYSGKKASDLTGNVIIIKLLLAYEIEASKKKLIKIQNFINILDSTEDESIKQKKLVDLKLSKWEVKEFLNNFILSNLYLNAIVTGDEETVKESVAHGRGFDQEIQAFKPFENELKYAVSPLSIAFRSGNRNIIKIFLDANVTVTPSLFASAIKYDYQEVIDYCLNKDKSYANQIVPVKEKGMEMTALHCAALGGRLEIVKRLCEAGADVNAFSGEEGTPLHVATMTHDNPEIVSYLLERGANVNANNADHPLTPLKSALMYKHPKIAAVLIESGANISEPVFDELWPIHFAIEMNSLDLVHIIYERDEYQRTVVRRGMDLLQVAEHYNRPEILKYLTARKNNVNVDDVVCIETSNGRNKYQIRIVHKKDCVSDEPRIKKRRYSSYSAPQPESNSPSMLTTTPGTMFSKTEQSANSVVEAKKEKRETSNRPRKEKWKVKTKQITPLASFVCEKKTYTWFGGLISSDKIDGLRDFSNGFYLSPERYLKSEDSRYADDIDELLGVETCFDKYQGIKQLRLYPPVYVDLVIGDEGDPNAHELRLKVQYEVKKKGTPSRIACVKIPADEIDGEEDSKGPACLILGVKFLEKGFHDGYRCNNRLKVVIPREFLTEFGISKPEHEQEERPKHAHPRR